MLYDLIIIGGGPAGLSAGIYAARKKLKTLLITKQLGGQPIEASQVENYLGFPEILGTELAQKFSEHLRKFENVITIKEGESVDKINKLEINKLETDRKEEIYFEVVTDRDKYQTKTIIIATGLRPKKLEIPGEEEYLGKGVVFCATCDAPLFKDKVVAVVGAGNAGLDAALQLTKYAKKIYLFNKYSDLTKGDPVYIDKVQKSDLIEIINNAKIKEIKGDRFVASIVWENSQSGEQQKIPVQGVFVEIGSRPATDFAKDLVEFNEKGEIIVDHKINTTSCPGIFAAGDVTDIPYKQIAIAVGEGAKATLSAYNYLIKKH